MKIHINICTYMYKAPETSRVGTLGRRRAEEAGIRAQVVAKLIGIFCPGKRDMVPCGVGFDRV